MRDTLYHTGVLLSDKLEQARTSVSQHPFDQLKPRGISKTHMGSSPSPTKMVDTPASCRVSKAGDCITYQSSRYDGIDHDADPEAKEHEWT
jgi:hypothetical protein